MADLLTALNTGHDQFRYTNLHFAGHHPREAPDDVAQRVAGLRAGGATLAAIAYRLNEERAPTARGGTCWHPATVRAVLNRAA
jgi:hypothetical protein